MKFILPRHRAICSFCSGSARKRYALISDSPNFRMPSRYHIRHDLPHKWLTFFIKIYEPCNKYYNYIVAIKSTGVKHPKVHTSARAHTTNFRFAIYSNLFPFSLSEITSDFASLFFSLDSAYIHLPRFEQICLRLLLYFCYRSELNCGECLRDLILFMCF